MKAWTTDQQTEFLESMVPQHLQYSANNKVHVFWPILTSAWLLKWPETDVPPTIDPNTGKEGPTLRARLQQWYNNHSGARRKTNTKISAPLATSASTSGSKKNSLLLHKQERVKSDFIAYQSLYWDKKLRGPVMAEWEVHRHTLGIPDAEHYKHLQAFRNKRCREMLAEETTAVKEEVERVRKMGKGQFAVMKDLKDKIEADLGENTTPEEVEAKRLEAEELSRKQAMQRYVDQVPDHVNKMLKDIHQKTGFVATVMFGGIYPNQGGAVRGHIYHTELPDRRTFETSMPGFQENVAKPFAAFLNSVYTAEQRRNIAIPISAEASSSKSGTPAPPAASTTASASLAAPGPSVPQNIGHTSSSAPPTATATPPSAAPTPPPAAATQATPPDLGGTGRSVSVPAVQSTGPAGEATPKNNGSSAPPNVAAKPLLPGQFVAKTAYEHERNANIARNYEMMRSLGLEGGAKAMKIFAPVERKKRGRQGGDEPTEATRRSSRVQAGFDSSKTGETSARNDGGGEETGPAGIAVVEGEGDGAGKGRKRELEHDNDTTGGDVPQDSPDTSGSEALDVLVASQTAPTLADTAMPKQTAIPTPPSLIASSVPAALTPDDASATMTGAASLVPVGNGEVSLGIIPGSDSITKDTGRDAVGMQTCESGAQRGDSAAKEGEEATEEGKETIEDEEKGENAIEEGEKDENAIEEGEEGDNAIEGEDDLRRAGDSVNDCEGDEDDFVDGLPEDAPGYIETIWEYLVGASASEDWSRAMELWARFERSLGYPEGRGRPFEIATVKRPAEVGTWIKRGHPEEELEDIPFPARSVDKFGNKVRSWWTVLQPAVRGNEWPLLRDIPDDESWPELAKGGRNGFKLILVALNWWLRGTCQPSEENKALSVLEDVVFVLERMLKKNAGPKRKAEEEAGGDEKRAKLSG